MQAVEALVEPLDREQWAKIQTGVASARNLRLPLDRAEKGKSEALPVSEAVREAVVHSEGIRQHPELVQGEGQRAGVLRGLLLVWSVLLIAQAGGLVVAERCRPLRQAVRYAGEGVQLRGKGSIVWCGCNRAGTGRLSRGVVGPGKQFVLEPAQVPHGWSEEDEPL